MSTTHFLPLKLNQVNLALNKTPVLNDITLSFNSKGISIIMGSNGSGKTLLLKCCASLLPPSSGSIEWQQCPTPPKVTWVPQQPVLLDRSVLDNIHLSLAHHKLQNIEQRCEAALEWANIKYLSDKNAIELSTGEQQLVALARAWSLSPSILLLDEPIANLDPARRNHINELIKAMSQSCKIIMTSHSVKQVQELAAHVILLEKGSVVADLPKETFFSSDEYKRFINDHY
ncbi:MAG: energy-coupling factor ABC transporter ATP-binding protein [Cellvibrionaceae bacterium]